MEEKDEEEKGLPEIYLSPSRRARATEAAQPASDTEPSTWDDTDTEPWTSLLAEATLNSDLTSDLDTYYLGQREEIEGGSSQESQNTSLVAGENQEVGLEESSPIGMGDGGTEVLQMLGIKSSGKAKLGDSRLSGQRGETPGSDCPPMVNLGAFARALRRPLVLDTQVGPAGSTELVFSPGGDQGFMVVPAPLTPLEDSGSDTEALEWVAAYGAVGGVPALVPVRDVVEGADNATTPARMYGGGLMAGGGIEGLERNSPAGLSTPDGELDLSVASRRSLEGKKVELTKIRPPVVGQSEEVEVVERKDLGSTDGEESSNSNDGQPRPPPRAPDLFCPTEAQPGSLGSQSENTDSVKTVVDISRGEGQGCETDPMLNNPGLLVATAMQLCPKPTFVVGGPISPRGKYKQFQNTVRDRMQDMKASLESQEAGPELDRDRYLAQPPLYPSVTLVSEQEVSLASMVSVESTNPPDSSERVTSPSVLSVSSAASSRRMEWDSGADVGYSGGVTGGTPEAALTSLSTLERIAIGSYASVLRTEPEGTTQVRERQRIGKRGGRLGMGRLGGQPGNSRQYSALEGTTSSSTHSSPSHRIQQVCVSSSEEDLSNRLASPGQSPRRRPRRRSLVVGSREGDSPQKRFTRVHPGLSRRLKELVQEHSEGKSSSLVELGRVEVGTAHHRRSSSQYSLSLHHHLSDTLNIKSSKNSSKGMAGAANTSTSTSTLIPSVSPQPASDGTSSTQVADLPAYPHSPMTTDSKHSSLASLAASESHYAHVQIFSSNDLSPRSQDSSDLEVQEARDTDQDSLASHLPSYHHPHNLKARKNSENARNHENLARQGDQDQAGVWKGREHYHLDSASSPTSPSNVPNQIEVEGLVDDSREESLQVSNAALQSLSVRLLGHIQALGKAGCLGHGRDYHKLRDYATFIGVPAATEEERRLRQGVANVIMRMFGEIGGLDHTSDTSHASDTLPSDTFPSDTLPSATSNTIPSDTLPSDTLPAPSDTSDTQSGKHWPIQEHDSPVPPLNQSLDIPHSPEMKKNGEEVREKAVFEEHQVSKKQMSEEEERCTTPGGTVLVVPYRPPSSTRTYYMAVLHEHEDGLVEGKGAPDTSPDPSPPSSLSPVPRREVEVIRGQAEGWREEGRSPPPPLVSSIPTHKEEDAEWVGTGREGWTEDHDDVAVATDWWCKQSPAHSPPSTDNWSPLHHRPSWHLLRPTHWQEQEKEEGEEDEDGRERAAAEWWAGHGGRERLYQDRQGTLHLAQQPPGYQEDRDSHPSESLSDQDPCRPAPPRPGWTSSGSESAYETIRERHRRVDEALASSFEFYSTSPRPARLISCTPPSGQDDDDDDDDVDDVNDDNDNDDEEEASRQEESLPPQLPSPSSLVRPAENDRSPTHRPTTHSQHPPPQPDSHHTSHSSHTEGNDVSSQISLIQLQKQHHVRKIQRHILTLEKLERALLQQLGDSLGSEGSFRKKMTDGRYHTEPDTNMTQHNIVGQSGTGTSSLMSSDYSNYMSQRWHDKPPQDRVHVGQLISEYTRSAAGDTQELQSTPSQSISKSHSSSPQIAATSQYSSDLTSSRGSTMRQVEKEVRRLASAEEKSRSVMQKSRGARHRPRENKQGLSVPTIKSMQREEPKGEEDPGHLSCITQEPSTHTAQNNSSEFTFAAKRKSSREGCSHGRKGVATSGQQHSTAKVILEDKQGASAAASDIQIKQRGGGRKARDRNHAGKSQVDKESDRSSESFTHQKRDAVSSVSSSAYGSRVRDEKHQRDFAQMFPSSESVLLGGCLNVGIQTGDSLLYPSRRGKKISSSSGSSSSSSSSPMHATSTESDRRRGRERGGERKNVKLKSAVEKNKNIGNHHKEYITSADGEQSVSTRDQLAKDVPRPGSFRKAVKTAGNERSSKLQCEEVRKENNRCKKVETEMEKTQTKSPNRATSLKVKSAKVRSKPISQRKEAWSKSSRERPPESLRPGSGKGKCRPRSEQNTKISSRPGSGREPDSRAKHGNAEHVKRNTRSRIQLEPKSESEDRSTSNSRSEYSSWSETARDKSFPSGDHESSESTSTGEVGEAELDEKTTRKGHRQRRGELEDSPSNSRDDTQPSQNQIGHLQHTTNQGIQPTLLLAAGVGEALKLKRVEHSVFVIPPPGQKQGVPGNQLSYGSRDDQDGQLSYGKIHSERNMNDPLAFLGLNEESDVQRNAQNQLYTYKKQSQTRVTNVIDTCLDSTTAKKQRAIAEQTTTTKADIASCQEPVQFDISLDNKENFQPRHTTISTTAYTAAANMRVLLEKSSEQTLSLQEALARAKPKYMREASDRHALIHLKKEMRQSAQHRNHQIVAQIPPNLQTPSTLQRFLYKPELSPLFSYRDIRHQNQRLYNLLPESGASGVRQQRHAESRTNRLMGCLYSQRLRKKVMKGQVSHAHKEIVTPISSRARTLHRPPTHY